MKRLTARPLLLALVLSGLTLGTPITAHSAPPRDQVAADCLPQHAALTTSERALSSAERLVGQRTGQLTTARSKVVAQRARVARARQTVAIHRKKGRLVKARAARRVVAQRTARLVKLRLNRDRAAAALRTDVQSRDRARATVTSHTKALATCRAAQSKVTGPVSGGEHGYPATSSTLDLAARGYTEKEYFLDGTATAYERSNAWTSQGQWEVRPTTKADYRTRLLVRAPARASAFNGTVVVEWLNVSGNSDADVDFPYMVDEIVRGGYAWVGVSAQSVGVNSASEPGNAVGSTVMGLKNWDPKRYGSLVHPGDAYSYDIFSQAGKALRSAEGVDPLPGMKVRTLIAAGQSQSSYRLLTYTNAIHRTAGVYDGLVIHGRAGVGAPLGEGRRVEDPEGPDGPSKPSAARVRTDLKTPVLQLISETELFETGGGAPGTIFAEARQSDTATVRTWEMAGTAHSDKYLVTLMNQMYQRQFSDARDLSPVLSMINDGPQRQISAAALRAMNQWIATGTAPASVEPLRVVDGAIARDQYGNALGGVRTPAVDVPVATLSGQKRFVALNGFTDRFSAQRLHEIYGSHTEYLRQFTEAAHDAVDRGHLVAEDAQVLIAQAVASSAGDPVPVL